MIKELQDDVKEVMEDQIITNICRRLRHLVKSGVYGMVLYYAVPKNQKQEKMSTYETVELKEFQEAK